jgi:hypothetical protein
VHEVLVKKIVAVMPSVSKIVDSEHCPGGSAKRAFPSMVESIMIDNENVALILFHDRFGRGGIFLPVRLQP